MYVNDPGPTPGQIPGWAVVRALKSSRRRRRMRLRRVFLPGLVLLAILGLSVIGVVMNG